MLALVSCDSVIGGLGGEKVEYTPDGRRLVEVKIPTGSVNRSIDDTIAEGETNYVEVVFEDPDVAGTFYRDSGFKGTTLTVSLPEGDYTSKAVMLVGRMGDNILLGTGTITSGGDVSGPGEIEFTVDWLNTNLTTGSATFVIDDESGTPPLNGTGTDFFYGLTDKGSISGSSSCFQVPTGTEDIEASLTFTSGFSNVGSNIKVNGAPDVLFVPFGSGSTTAPSVDVSDISFSTGTPANGGKVEFKFETATEFTYMITFNIPVVGLGTASLPGPITWNIRGGTNIGKLDFTGGKDEGVVISVLDAPERTKYPQTIEG
jgi:hypothetical protein